MIIDIHAHGLPDETLAGLREGASRFPNVSLEDTDHGPRLSFAGGQQTRPVNPKLRQAPPREAFLEEQGIDLQLVGGWLDAFGYEIKYRGAIGEANCIQVHPSGIMFGAADLRRKASAKAY